MKTRTQAKSLSITVLRLSAFALSIACAYKLRMILDNAGATLAAVLMPAVERMCFFSLDATTNISCLFYISDAADEEDSGEFGCSRMLQKKKEMKLVKLISSY